MTYTTLIPKKNRNLLFRVDTEGLKCFLHRTTLDHITPHNPTKVANIATFDDCNIILLLYEARVILLYYPSYHTFAHYE